MAIKTKGRPKQLKGARSLSAFEHVEKELVKQKKQSRARKQKKDTLDDEKHVKQKKRVRIESPPPLKDIVSFKGSPFQIHASIPREYIRYAENVKSDGWCGYRTVAALVFGNQDKYMDVKRAMLQQVEKNECFYRRYWCVHDVVYEGLIKRLRMVDCAFLPVEHWFDAAQELQIAADTFQRPFAFYAEEEELNNANRPKLYLPFFYNGKRKINYSPSIVRYVGNVHFAAVHMRRSISTITWPPVDERFESVIKQRGYDSNSIIKNSWSHLKIADPYLPSPTHGTTITIDDD
ncbi:predicted protein [Lichtheimia corymbifera JMRC:FSU:9682]|uniref:OTU domain-containing protein n=1 Tax=Lichtheimia corymbifera JMRC:FSU:9682 TaxID=1263082 RepID=A0A068SGH7_9FUNG|nr:predicted protein [Lichtheimia corymbifera JMRC:FSU:9682]